MTVFSTKPDWMLDSTWRAIRTAWQTFWASFSVALVAALLSYSTTGTFDWNALWLQGVVVAVAAAIAKIQNLGADQTE